MLMALDSRVYAVDPVARGEPQVVVDAEGVRRVAGAGGVRLIVVDDGRATVLTGHDRREIRTGISDTIESLLIQSVDPLSVLIGTTPAHVYRLADDGRPAARIAPFDALDCRDGWHTPWGGPPAVRSLADTPDGTVYADIHVGSIMRSADHGRSWQPVTPDLHEDVHQVATCAAAPDRVAANTARAVYLSDDLGRSWSHRGDDLGARYGRAIAIDPTDPDVMLATVSDGPHGDDVHGQLYRTDDAGRTWSHVCDGFPDSTAQNINTSHVVFTADGIAWACVDRTLYVGDDHGRRWSTFWAGPEPIRMIDPDR